MKEEEYNGIDDRKETRQELPATEAAPQQETPAQPASSPATEDADDDGRKGGSGSRRKESEESLEAKKELKRIVQEIAREDERPMSSNFTLKKILGGEFLKAKIIKQYKWLIVIIVGFVIVYVSNRYSCDQKRIKISKLNKELEDAKFRAMTTTSELTKISRESNVLQMLQNCKDSVLHIPNQPPYIINVPEQ